jgi:hypothetical protein
LKNANNDWFMRTLGALVPVTWCSWHSGDGTGRSQQRETIIIRSLSLLSCKQEFGITFFLLSGSNFKPLYDL